MSQTEVITVEATERRCSASIRAPDSIHPCSRGSPSPQLLLLSTGDKQNVDAIELAQLPVSSKHQSAATPNTVSGLPGSSVTVPWWLPHLQVASLCWAFYLAGWNDGTTGPLLPRIQDNYHVGYTVVSLIFIFNFLGFMLGAIVNVYVADKLGFGVAMAIGSSSLVVGYCLQTPAPPFPVFVLSYVVTGFGLALNEAGANGYIASLKKNPATKMGILHSCYGFGAFCSPLSATQFAQKHRWSFQYLTSLSLAVSNVLLIMIVFRFQRQEDCLRRIGQAPDAETTTEQRDGNRYRQIFRLKELHLLAFFILVLVGAGSSISSWTVTYVIDLRKGGPSAGYIASGFAGGITLGRLGLLWVNKKVGERRVVFLYTIIAIGLELIAWLVPSLIGDAVAVAAIGFVTGPLFPLVVRHATKILPPYLLTGCIGWIAGFGQAGAAFAPFMTGAIASKAGIQALQPLVLGMMGCMLCIWAVVPQNSRRLD